MMSDYNNMSVVTESDEEPPEIENDTVDNDNDDENKSTNEEENKVIDKVNTEDNQLAGMITFVWISLILGIIIFIAFMIVKKRQVNEVKVEYVNVASGMISLHQLTTENNEWTDYMNVEKKIQENGGSITMFLEGKAENYDKMVYIPLTSISQYNSIENGDRIAFTFSRLSIENQEFILIKEWSKI